MQNQVNTITDEIQDQQFDWLEEMIDEENPDADEEWNAVVDHLSRVRVDYDDDPDFPSLTLFVDGVFIEKVRLWGKLNWGGIERELERKGMQIIGKREVA